MQIISLPEPFEIPEVRKIALNGLSFINSSLSRRVEEHKMCFDAFWKNYDHTPDSILAEMGSSAIVWLALAGESVEHIGRSAAIINKTVNDFIDPSMYVPPRAFIINPDLSVTLESSLAGFDEWGRPISGYTPPVEEDIPPVEEPIPPVEEEPV